MTTSKKFKVPVHDIRISPTLDTATVLKTLFALHHPLYGFDPDLILPLNTEEGANHGEGNWDRNWKYKSLCVTGADDRVPSNWTWDATLEHLRPVIKFVVKDDGTFETILYHRRLIVTGAKGHSHGRFNPNDPSKFMEAEDIILTPATLVPLSEAEVKAQYSEY